MHPEVPAAARLPLDAGDDESEVLVSRKDVAEFARNFPRAAKRYVAELFPIASWIPHYNLRWALGDAIAGTTIGLMVVPQALAYAKLAGLPPEYGLYSSFTGVLIYCLFATSKDVTIGPTAVMALATGQILARVNPSNSVQGNVAIATTLALMAGLTMLGVGLFRLGFILEFIPGPVVAGFTTGGAVTVVISQIPALFGIKGVNTRADTYVVVQGIFQNIGTANWIDCIFGLVSAAVLVGLKLLSRRYARRSISVWYLGVSRFALVVLVSILASWLVNHSNPTSPPMSILKTVPSGFTYVAVPPITDPAVASAAASGLPVVVLLALLEHISIAKSFGRINGYRINPSQEAVALGVTNVAASFFGGFPATGSFSRTAVKSQAGVRTPLAGILTGLIVLLAIFVLGPMFYWIPNATLAAVIMHGITELVSPPSYFKRLWGISVTDFIVAAVTILLSCVMTIELAIEVAVCLALAFLLLRLAFPSFSLLFRDSATGEWIPSRNRTPNTRAPPPGVIVFRPEESMIYPNSDRIRGEIWDTIAATTKDQTPHTVEISGRLTEGKGWNEYAGVSKRWAVDSKFEASVAPMVAEWNTSVRLGGESEKAPRAQIEVTLADSPDKKQDLTLMVPGSADPLHNSGTVSTVSTVVTPATAPVLAAPSFEQADLPSLRAIVLDLSAVNDVDSTGAQALLDLLADADRRSGASGVRMYFVHARRRVRRVLVRAGLVAAQIAVPVVEAPGEDPVLEKPEIALTEGYEGKGAATFDMWRTIRGLRFGAVKQAVDAVKELPPPDLEAGTGSAVPQEIPDASAETPRISVSHRPATGLLTHEGGATTAEEVIEAAAPFANEYFYSNMDDALEAAAADR
ncbi:sulfate transporter family-domain-containing protein [Hyaloraphidium curvatum]|nr:sulfate transporter family-domain-containing protein [Hyaloraphidium curvatum]